MRYSLLDYLACPACIGPLLCVTEAEIPSVMSVGRAVRRHPGSAPPPVRPGFLGRMQRRLRAARHA
jgi:uncharacterized protein YbaR (Trm112 family)